MAGAPPSWAELPLDLIDRMLEALAQDCETQPIWSWHSGPASLRLNRPRTYSDADERCSSQKSAKHESAKRERHTRRRQRRLREEARQWGRERRSVLAASQVCRSWREAACRRTTGACLYLERNQDKLQLALATLRAFSRRRPVHLELTWDQGVSCRLQPAFVRAVAHLRELHLVAMHPGFLDVLVWCPALTSLVLEARGESRYWSSYRRSALYGQGPYDYFLGTHQLYRAAGLECFLRAMPCLEDLTVLGVNTPLVERRVDWTACSGSVTRLSLQLALWNASALKLPRLQELKLAGCDFSRDCAFLQGGCLPRSLTALSLERVTLEGEPCFTHVRRLSLVDCRFRNRYRLVPRPGYGRQQSSYESADDGDFSLGPERNEGPSWGGVCDLSLCTALTHLTSQDGGEHRQPHLRYVCGLPPTLHTLHLEACFKGVDVTCLLGSITGVVELDLHICGEEQLASYTCGCSGHRAREFFPLPCVERLAELPCLQRLHVVVWEDPCCFSLSDKDGEELTGYFREGYEDEAEIRRYRAGLEQVRQAVVGRGGECVIQFGEQDYDVGGSGEDYVSSWDSEGSEPKPQSPSKFPLLPQQLPSWSLGRPAWCLRAVDWRNRQDSL